MDLEIMALEMTLEDVLKQSELPPEVKRLILVELAGKMAVAAKEAIKEQSKEVKDKNAESVL